MHVLLTKKLLEQIKPFNYDPFVQRKRRQDLVNVSRIRENGSFYIFKKEGDLNFIVPIVAYNCYSFSTQNIIKPNINIENNVVSLLLNDSNIKLF